MVERFVRNKCSPLVRIGYPWLCGLFLLIGVGYVTAGPVTINNSSAIRLLDQGIPLPLYGLTYIAVGVFGFAASTVGNRQGCLMTISIMGSLMAVWSGIVLAVTINDGGYSWGTFGFPASISVFCYLMARAILHREGETD